MRDSYSKHLVSPSPWSVCEQFLRDTITQFTFYIIPNMATSKRKSTSLGDHEICNFWINLIYLFIWRFFSVNIWNFIFNLQHKLQNARIVNANTKRQKQALVIILSEVFKFCTCGEKSVHSSNETHRYIEVNEPPLYLRRLRLTLQLMVKIKANIDKFSYPMQLYFPSKVWKFFDKNVLNLLD